MDKLPTSTGYSRRISEPSTSLTKKDGWKAPIFQDRRTVEAQVIRLPIQHVIQFIWNRELLLTNHTSDPRHFEDVPDKCFQQIWITLDSVYILNAPTKNWKTSQDSPWWSHGVWVPSCASPPGWRSTTAVSSFRSRTVVGWGLQSNGERLSWKPKMSEGPMMSTLKPWAVVGSVGFFFLVENLKIACRVSLLCWHL